MLIEALINAGVISVGVWTAMVLAPKKKIGVENKTVVNKASLKSFNTFKRDDVHGYDITVYPKTEEGKILWYVVRTSRRPFVKVSSDLYPEGFVDRRFSVDTVGIHRSEDKAYDRAATLKLEQDVELKRRYVNYLVDNGIDVRNIEKIRREAGAVYPFDKQ